MSTQTQEKNNLLAALQSPIIKKIITGITGIALGLFVLVHMLGNLSYFFGPEAYNLYSLKITSGFGFAKVLYYVIEIGLLLFFAFHIVVGIKIYLGKRKARQHDYAKYKSAGRPSLQSFSSRTMIWTGLLLLIFLVIHLKSFRFGPGIDDGYMMMIDGKEVHDVARVVTEKFQSPLYAFGYPIAMILLGFHLRHGIWSAFQSLGVMTPRLTPVVYALGGLLAVGIAVGFLVLPLYIFFSA